MDIIDKRKQSILKALITDYVLTYEPVASQRLVSFYNFDVRGATIRSEMNELAGMGYLLQTHKSGGRIPTDLGYRFYVDNLIDIIHFDNQVLEIVSKALKNKSEIESLIKSAVQMLSDITGFVAIASYPKINNSKLKYLSITNYSSKKYLFIMAFSNGYIIHKILDFDFDNAIYSLERAMNYLNDNFLDKEVDYLLSFQIKNNVFSDIVLSIINILKEYSYNFNESRKYTYEGVGKLLKYPEFNDLSKLKVMLATLENRNLLDEIFKDTVEKITVRIGSENLNNFMQEYTLVSCQYKFNKMPAGVIGIIGPTRMDYSITIGGVDIISSNLSNMLTNFSY